VAPVNRWIYRSTYVSGRYLPQFLRNQVVSFLIWLWWVIYLPRFEFKSGTTSMVLPLCLFRLENRVWLSHGVQVTSAARRAAMRIVAGVGDLVQKTEVSQTHVGYSGAGRSRGQVTLCVTCTVHEETKSAYFLVEPQNQGRWFVSGLASKLRSTVYQWLGLKNTWIICQ
jgi:hypothetical protein